MNLNSYLIHCALKGKAGIGNLLRALDVLETLHNRCECIILARKLSMDFYGKPFGLRSSGTIQNLSNTPSFAPYPSSAEDCAPSDTLLSPSQQTPCEGQEQHG